MPGLVLLVDHSDLSRIIFHALAAEFQIDIVIREARVRRLALLAKRLKRLGWSTTIGQVMFIAFVLPWLRWESRRRRAEILFLYGVDDSSIPLKDIVDVTSANDDNTVALLRSLSPKVIVVSGTRILEEKMLNATEAILLNTHVGITPLYRGVHGGYWALASADPENCGTTIHKIDKGIDTGDIAAQITVPPTNTDNFATYPLLQIAAALPLLKKAVRDALNGTLMTFPADPDRSKLWSHPTAFQYLKTRLSRGVR